MEQIKILIQNYKNELNQLDISSSVCDDDFGIECENCMCYICENSSIVCGDCENCEKCNAYSKTNAYNNWMLECDDLDTKLIK